MKKALIMIIALGGIALQQAQSQVLIGLLFGEKLNNGNIEFGLNGIVNNSRMNIDNNGEMRHKIGFGLYLDYKFSEKFILATNFFFASPKGQVNFDDNDPFYFVPDTNLYAGARTERILNYFELPIMLEYRPIPQLGLGVGGYLSLLTKAEDIYSGEFADGSVGFQRSIQESMNRIDYGIMGGIHYHFKGNPGSQIRISYMLGIANIFKDPQLTANNEVFQIGVLVPIKFGILPTAE